MSKFAVEHPNQFNDWYKNSQYVACLSIKDEESLLSLVEKLRERGVAVSVFREPDYNQKATSIAIEACDQGRRLTGSLRLAQKEYYEQWAESQGIPEDPVSNFHISNIEKNKAS